jgi:hypothetical protein
MIPLSHHFIVVEEHHGSISTGVHVTGAPPRQKWGKQDFYLVYFEPIDLKILHGRLSGVPLSSQIFRGCLTQGSSENLCENDGLPTQLMSPCCVSTDLSIMLPETLPRPFGFALYLGSPGNTWEGAQPLGRNWILESSYCQLWLMLVFRSKI